MGERIDIADRRPVKLRGHTRSISWPAIEAWFDQMTADSGWNLYGESSRWVEPANSMYRLADAMKSMGWSRLLVVKNLMVEHL